jgi:cbb3-type cytochrome oxidase subunit 3
MRLSELVSNMTPTIFTEVALVLFLGVFAAVSYRALRRGARAQCEQWAKIPLHDEGDAGGQP